MNNNTSDNDTSDPVDRIKKLVVQKACEALENIGKGSSFQDAYNLAKLAIRVTSHHNESKPIEKQPGIRVTSHHNDSKPVEKQPVIPPPFRSSKNVYKNGKNSMDSSSSSPLSFK